MNQKKHLGKWKYLLEALAVVALYVVLYLSMQQKMPFDFLNMSRTNQTLLSRMCIYILLAVSLNLVVGFLGELSLGHAGFYAVGAYAGCLVAVKLTSMSLPIMVVYPISLLVGGVAAALAGLLIGSSILRLRGDYLAIVTLAFGEVIRSFAKIIPGLGGTQGLLGIPSFDERVQSFTWGFVLVVLTLLIVRNIIKSRHGVAVTAIRDNAIAAESIGINVKVYKIKIFAISAFFAGVAGVMFGFYKNSVMPSDFTYNLSIEVLIMVVLGRIGSLRGSVIAAIILTGLPDWLRKAGGSSVLSFIAEQRMLVYSIVLILMMLFTSAPAFIHVRERIVAVVKGVFGKLLPKKEA